MIILRTGIYFFQKENNFIKLVLFNLSYLKKNIEGNNLNLKKIIIILIKNIFKKYNFNFKFFSLKK